MAVTNCLHAFDRVFSLRLLGLISLSPLDFSIVTLFLSSLYRLKYIAVAVLVFSTVELAEENGLCCKHK